MAANEKLVSAARKAHQSVGSLNRFGGLGGIDKSINSYFDSIIENKKKEEELAAEKTMLEKAKKNKINQNILTDTAEEEASTSGEGTTGEDATENTTEETSTSSDDATENEEIDYDNEDEFRYDGTRISDETAENYDEMGFRYGEGDRGRNRDRYKDKNPFTGKRKESYNEYMDDAKGGYTDHPEMTFKEWKDSKYNPWDDKKRSKSPLTYNAGLVAGARQMYQAKRYGNQAMSNALANAGKSIDGSIGDFLEMKTLEKETKKEEERLKKEKKQQERDRQIKVLNNFNLKSGQNNIDQLGSGLYKQVQDQLYAARDEYIAIYDEKGPDTQRKLNDIMTKMTSLDSELTSHSTNTENYKAQIDGNLLSVGIDPNITNLHNAHYTNATEVDYEDQSYNFSNEIIDGNVMMVLTDPNATEQISSIETSMNSLKQQKDQYTEEEYNNAIKGYEESLSQYKKILNPELEFTSSTILPKTDGSGINNLLGQIDQIANNGQTESLQNIQGMIEQNISDNRALLSYANDTIPGQGKSMRKHFEEMFPDGIPIEDESGDFLEYRTIDQIFNSRSSYYRENDGEEVLRDLTKDYYTRLAINRFNVHKQGNAQIMGIEGSDILKMDNYGETTFGLSEEEGNKFRAWVNKKYPVYAKQIDLDKKYSSFTNTYIAKAWKKYGEEYNKTTQFQEYDDIISQYYLNK